MNAVTQPRNGEFFRRMVFALLTVLTIALIALASMPVHAAAPAGAVIGNQATATYNDAGGTGRSATSNLVQTTVQQVKSFTLNTTPQSRTAAPGQTVYYPHYITNTGNGTDTYGLTIPVASGTFSHTTMAYYIDADGNGVPDSATAITSTGPLASGGIFRFVVAGAVPGAAADGTSGVITVAASDTGSNTASNVDTTTVSNSSITVTKSLSVTSGPSPSAAPITVTLSYTNSGTAAATNVNIVDTLPAGMTYVAASGLWSVSAATPLSDAAEVAPATEQGGATGIRYSAASGVITANIGQINAGVSGTVQFQVNIASGLAPSVINNFASYTTTSQPSSSNTNTASYTVAQTASVAFNGSSTTTGLTDSEPVSFSNVAGGTTLTYNNFVWNLGNATDTFDITIASNGMPAGTSVQLFQQDGASTLINSAGTAAPDTGPIPGKGSASCPSPLVNNGLTGTNLVCGYRVVVKVTLPSNAAASVANFDVTLLATSGLNTAVSDSMVDRIAGIVANTVDVTNDLAAPPAGAALAANGLGAGTTAVIKTNTLNPSVGGSTTTTFLVYVTNKGAVTDTFNLTAAGAANAPLTTAALPSGWSVSFRFDGGGSCGTLGSTITATNPLATNTAQLVCAVVTIPSTTSGNAAPGNYDLMFAATSQTNAAVSDYIVDRVTLNSVRSITITPNNTQQTFPGGSVTYSHTIANSGNVSDTATFAGGCLSDSRAAQSWSSTAYIDGVPPWSAAGNGVLDIGTDTLIVCGTTTLSLAVGESRTIFVRVFASGSATSTDPANVTTLTATYNSLTVSATDTTSVTDGLVLLKEQVALNPIAGVSPTCNTATHSGYTSSAIAAGSNTVPGACIAYRITATNTTATTINSVVINDIIPPNTKIKYSCSGNALTTPNVTVGSIDASSPANGTTGTLKANVGTLTSTQSAVLYFCVQID